MSYKVYRKQQNGDIVEFPLDASSLEGQTASQLIDSAVSEIADIIKNYSTTEEVNLLISTAITNAAHIKKEIVTSLPESPVENVIYMIDEDGNGVYEEYLLINNELTKIGDTKTDLNGYATEDWVANQIGQAITGTQDGILVKSVNTEQFNISSEGKLSINSISTDLIIQGQNELFLDGGKADT